MTVVFRNHMGSSRGLSSFSHYWTVDQDITEMEFHLINIQEGKLQVIVKDNKGVIRLQSGFLVGRGSSIYVLASQPEKCSFGTTPGDLPRGDWRAEIVAYSNSEVSYSLEVTWGKVEAQGRAMEFSISQSWAMNSAAPLNLNQYPWQECFNTETTWYRGDFHTHSTMSDGRLTPAELMVLAEDRALDFITITDHNILPTRWVRSNVLVIPGIEVSSQWGHFNVLGLDQMIEWWPSHPDQGIMTPHGMIRLMNDARTAGGFCSLNHPVLKPWDWQVELLPLELLDGLEIWNDPTYPDNRLANERALKAWDILWNEGYQVVGIGGSDSHLRPNENYPGANAPSLVGDPCTCIRVEGLSARGIIDELHAGRVYVTRGPELVFQAQVRDRSFQVGSDLSAVLNSSCEIRLSANYTDVPAGSRLIWVVNGEQRASVLVVGKGRLETDMVWNPEEYTWMRAELRDRKGDLLAVTNPIYQGKRRPTIRYWRELLSKLDSV